MVKILANGEIVSDDYQTNETSSKNRSNKSSIGRILPANENEERQQVAENRQGFLPTANIVQYINQCLTNYGAPTFALGRFTFKPIVSLGFLLATLIWGINGALFSGLLYFVVYYSQTAAPNIPFIRNLLQRIGLANRTPNTTPRISAQAMNSSGSTSDRKTKDPKQSNPTKSFPGAGHRLND